MNSISSLFLMFFVHLHMILYNVSVIIDDSSHDALLAWLKSELQSTTYDINFLKMLDSPHEGSTYCIQLITADESKITDFQQEVLIRIQEHISTKYTEKAFIFDSKMRFLPI